MNLCFVHACFAFLSCISVYPGHGYVVNTKSVNGKRGFGDRIVNGNDADIESHPWAVQLIYSDGGSQYRCTASILSKHTIVTAAHCLKRVSEGKGYYGDESDGEGESFGFTSSDVVIHPESQIDVGLIVLTDSLNLDGRKAKAISIPSESFHPSEGSSVEIAGWGKMCSNSDCTSQEKEAEELQEVKVLVQDQNTCGAADYQFCAGGEVKGVPMDACVGDSGGPVECEGKNGVFLCGVVSQGPAPPDCWRNPGTYVNVGSTTVREFIKSEFRTGYTASLNANMFLNIFAALVVLVIYFS